MICVLCGERSKGKGNDLSPFTSEGRCCDDCNFNTVEPARASNSQLPRSFTS